MAALLSARDQAPLLLAIEAAGGWCFGELGGIFPDTIEPANSSHHRRIAHSAVVNGWLLKIALENGPAVQQKLRLAAADHFAAAAVCREPITRLLRFTLGLLLHFLAGGVAGFPAGTMSHIALDFGSPRGIPLLTRGF